MLVSHARCSYVQRAVVALSEKGVAFERVDIDPARKPEWFLRLNPLGTTPVLLVPRDGATAPDFESAVICDYLDEMIDPALRPADALERAQHRAVGAASSALAAGGWVRRPAAAAGQRPGADPSPRNHHATKASTLSRCSRSRHP